MMNFVMMGGFLLVDAKNADQQRGILLLLLPFITLARLSLSRAKVIKGEEKEED